jgi:RNA polymerase sigma-70 factor (ECF subfamily)
MKLWESYASYMPSQPFVAWAIGVAKNVVRNKRRHDRVRAGTVVDSDICEQIGDVVADTLARENAALAEENEMLEKCIQRLPEPSMRLLRMRYGEGWSLRQMAESLGRTYATVNVTLSRIRNMLADCVRRQKAEIG